MKNIRRSGNDSYAIEGFPQGKFFVDTAEAIRLCRGSVANFVGGDPEIERIPGKSPDCVSLTPEVLKCLVDGGFFRSPDTGVQQ